MVSAEPAQCLDDGATDTAGRRRLARRRVLQYDLLHAEVQPPRAIISKKRDSHRHLIREPQKVGRVRAARLEARPGAPSTYSCQK